VDDIKFKEFMKAQRQEILKHKWLESEKAGRDLGQSAVMDWISKYAKLYRSWWNSYRRNKI